MDKPPCRYCGSTTSPLVRKLKTWNTVKQRGLQIQAPCCSDCFGRMRRRNSIVTSTPTHLSIEAGIKTVKRQVSRLSKRSTVNEILAVTETIADLEREQIALNAEFKTKAHEAQCLAEFLTETISSISQSKTLVEHLLSISYDNCRRIASRAIADKTVRLAVFKRDSWRCLKCGSDELLSIDHKIPVFRGGTNELDNLQTLCMPCNLKKGTKIEDVTNT